MKKGLIVTTLATLLAVSCGNGGGGSSGSNDWSNEVKELMNATIGEVLPYVELDFKTFKFEGEFEESTGGYFVAYDSSETDLLSGYGDKLKGVGFEAVIFEGETIYSKVTANEGLLFVQAKWNAATEAQPVGNVIYAEYYVPAAPFAEALEYFVDQGIEDVIIPKYETAEGSVELQEDYLTPTYFIYDSTHDEMDDFAEALTAAGWDLTTDNFGDYNGTFEDTRAQVYLGDYLQESQACIVLQFSLAPEVFDSWPSEAIAEMFAEYEETLYDVPAFASEAATFTVTTYEFFGMVFGVDVVVNGATDAEINTYLTETLPNAGWEVDTENGSAKKTFVDLDGIATIYLEEYNGSYYISLMFGLSVIPSPTFPAEAIADAFEALGLPAFEIPGPDGEGYTFEYKFDEENFDYLDDPAYCYDNMYINNMSSEQFEAYLKKLSDAGWVTESTKSPYDLTKHFDAGFTASLKLSYTESSSGNYATLRIYYIADPDAEATWPAEEIAELLGEGVTDVLPELVFEGATFKTYDDAYGKGVLAFVGEENQDAVMEAYAKTLGDAGFVPNDSGLYASPNGQFFVEIYKGTDGAIGLEISFPRNIASEIEAIMESRGAENWKAPDFSSLENKINLSNSGVVKSSYYQLVFTGNCESDVLAILKAANYTIPETPSASYGYECVDPTEQVEIDVLYLEANDVTLALVYYGGDIW